MLRSFDPGDKKDQLIVEIARTVSSLQFFTPRHFTWDPLPGHIWLYTIGARLMHGGDS